MIGRIIPDHSLLYTYSIMKSQVLSGRRFTLRHPTETRAPYDERPVLTAAPVLNANDGSHSQVEPWPWRQHKFAATAVLWHL